LLLGLPFASFYQESIPLDLQHKELWEERIVRLIRQQKKAQERKEHEQRQEQRLLKKQQRQLLKEREQQLLRHRPQPSDCRHCQVHFDSKNTLFRHLEHCKSQSRASSVASRSSASSRASSASSTSSAATTASILSIEKVQLQILSQLHSLSGQALLQSTSPPQPSYLPTNLLPLSTTSPTPALPLTTPALPSTTPALPLTTPYTPRTPRKLPRKAFL
jgi:hypothetical protein